MLHPATRRKVPGSAASAGCRQGPAEAAHILRLLGEEARPRLLLRNGNRVMQDEPGPGKRVLIVEDNSEAAVNLALLLRLDGHEVRTAPDGRAALAVAAAFRPEAVLLDIGLPVMDGYVVARWLRRQPGLENVLIIAVTGHDRVQDQRRALEEGFDVYLVKPLGLDEVRRFLRRLRQ
jgi:CheY-like chemotaxis protein